MPYLNTQRAADEIAEDIANLGMNKHFLVPLQNLLRREPASKAEEVLPILGLQKQGITDRYGRTFMKVEPGGTERLTGMPTDDIDSHLKQINRLYSIYKNAKDEKAVVRTYLTKLKTAIWDDLDAFAANAEQEGASDFVAKYKHARALYAAGEGDIPGATVSFNKYVADFQKPGVEPAQLVTGLFGKKGQNIGEAKVVQRAVGPDAWKGFESAWLTSAMRNNEGQFDALRFASQWYQLGAQHHRPCRPRRPRPGSQRDESLAELASLSASHHPGSGIRL